MYRSSHTDFFSTHANIYAQKLWKTLLPRFWRSYSTKVVLDLFILLKFQIFDENLILMVFI